MIRVLILENDPMAKKLMEIFLNSSKRYQLLPTLNELEAIDEYCLANHVDLVLMDSMEIMDSKALVVVEKVKKHFPESKLIVGTGIPEYSFMKRARELGADSFWYKEPNQEDLLSIMDRTMEGESVYPKELPVMSLGKTLSNDFSVRELEVLKGVVSGKTDAAIAEHLHLSVYTIKQYIKKILGKTGFANRTELAVRARESGIVIGEYED